MGSTAVWVTIDMLRFERRFGGGVCRHRVEQMRMQIEKGVEMRPIRINALEDGTFTIKDGRHRAMAHIVAGFSQILAYIENLPDTIIKILHRWWRLFYSPEILSKALSADGNSIIPSSPLKCPCLCSITISAPTLSCQDF